MVRFLNWFDSKTGEVIAVMCQVSSEGRAMPGPDGVICPLGTQISFVSATMPRDLENILEDVVPVIVVSDVL